MGKDTGITKLPSGQWRWRVMVNGINHNGTERTKTAAKAARAQRIADGLRGTLVAPQQITVLEWLNQWLDSKKPHRKPRTDQAQRDLLRLKIEPAIGDIALQKLAPAHLKKLYDQLNREELGESGQRQVHAFLKSALEEAVALELIIRNPANSIKPNPIKKKAKDIKAYQPEEAAKFLECAEHDPLGRMFIFQLTTGLRPGELAGLRWCDVDFASRSIEVVETVSDHGGRISVGTPKTENSSRTVVLSDGAIRLLEEQAKSEKEKLAVLGSQHERSGRIFTNTKGGVLRPNNFSRNLRRISETAGIKEITPHGLRHTYASLSLMHGVPVEIVSKQLGHSSIEFTLDTYRWVFDSEKKAWALEASELVKSDLVLTRI